MKKMKKLISLLLALIMVLSMTITAFAKNTNAHTITITNEKSGHTYTAYQVFAGDISDGKLTNIVWGDGVDGDDILTALKSLTNSPYASCNSAEDVADILKGFGDDSTQLDAFAKTVGSYLNSDKGVSSTESGSPYTINVTGDGYYFVKDTGDIAADDAATKYILNVIEDVEVKAKAEVPVIDKVIVKADSTGGKGTAQDVGSVVDFNVTTKVPEMDGYDSYTYIVHDTMSSGLTAVDEDSNGTIDVTVKIGGEIYTDFAVVQKGQSFTITFNNFIDQKEKAGQEIVITYSAIINKNALITDEETNKVDLTYSNDPNDDSSYGKTPEKVVYVYDFDLVVDKYTGDETDGERLAGAKFVLYKTVDQKNMYYFYNKKDDKVDWVALANDDAVTAAIKDGRITEVTTDVKGAATFQGLDSGTYMLHETEAPAGYNLLKEDVTVTITAEYNEDGTLLKSSATSTDKGQYQQTQKVENKSGATLPSTGGIGTTVFYAVGIILMAGAVFFVVRRKRA